MEKENRTMCRGRKVLHSMCNKHLLVTDATPPSPPPKRPCGPFTWEWEPNKVPTCQEFAESLRLLITKPLTIYLCSKDPDCGNFLSDFIFSQQECDFITSRSTQKEFSAPWCHTYRCWPWGDRIRMALPHGAGSPVY